MSKANTKDGSEDTDVTAPTVASPARAAAARPVADSGADTQLAGSEEPGTTIPGRAPDELIGSTLSGRYEVRCKLGQGGMGAVYEARHTDIGKRVALKVLLDKHAEKDQIVARLKQEARLASSIGHDNIVDITDFGITDTGRTFVVMEYLEGESLGECISKQGRLKPERAVLICAQIASALGAAHEKGIVHRDIKPDNIFITQRNDQDFVKVVDFGISKSMTPTDEDVRLTQTGMVLGTPLYMSPEQARGDDDLDHQIDIYALGVILYEAVTGEVPFQGKNYLNILTQVIADEPKSPSEVVPDIDRDLESVILKAMAKDREQRYQTMAALENDLQALCDPDTKSTGARITAARWRQKRDRKSKRSYAAWVLGLAGVVSICVIAVTMLMGPTESAKKAALVPPLADASVPLVAPSPDATPPAAFEVTTISVVSKPAGASIYAEGGLLVCEPAPCNYAQVKTRSQVELRAELEGYADATFTITPELDDGSPNVVRLKKLRAKDRRPRKESPLGNPGDKDQDKDKNKDGTGDVLGNPHKPSP